MPTITAPAVLSLARHFAAMGGWRTASTLHPTEVAALDELLHLGHVEPATKDRRDVYQLTSAGYAWLATQGS